MSPRVLYLGYGKVGCACLAELLASGFHVVGVVCRASDRQLSNLPSVFTKAQEAGLHCLEGTDPGAPDFVAAARELRPDLLLSVQYDRILKPPLLAVPRHGAFNLHFGPLPRLRGCFPTKWAILENEPAGVAFHAIDSGIDSGDLVDRVVVPLTPNETDETLYHRLEEVGHRLFERQLPWMRTLQSPRLVRQDPAQSSYHPKQLPFNGVIDWSRDAGWVERFIRAFTFPPHPAAKTVINGEEIEISAPVEIVGDLGLPPGQVAFQADGRVAIGCGSGSLLVERLCRDGHPISTAELCRRAAQSHPAGLVR